MDSEEKLWPKEEIVVVVGGCLSGRVHHGLVSRTNKNMHVCHPATKKGDNLSSPTNNKKGLFVP